MPIEHLTEMQYSTERKGPFKLYIFEKNSEYHRGGVYFMKKPVYPDEGEITIEEARERALKAAADNREVRITDSGDMLVFHSRAGKTLYPNNPEKFWEEIAA
jgi:hypothetical protein